MGIERERKAMRVLGDKAPLHRWKPKARRSGWYCTKCLVSSDKPDDTRACVDRLTVEQAAKVARAD